MSALLFSAFGGSGGSKYRWVMSVSLVFFMQIYLVFFFSQYTLVTSTVSNSPTRIYFVVEEEGQAGVVDMDSLPDPTLFAKPSQHGFSGAAWLRSAPFPYEVAYPRAPVEWVAPDVIGMGTSFLPTLRPSLDLAFLTATKPALPMPEMAGGRGPLNRAPVMEVQGELRGRQLLGEALKPPLLTDALFTNSVVRLVVRDTGETLTAVLEASSGSPAADQAALNHAKALRFLPVNRERGREVGEEGRTVVGTVIFRWFGGVEPEEENQRVPRAIQ